MSRVEQLTELRHFSQLPPEELGRLDELNLSIEVAGGDTLMSEGEVADCAYLVLAGRLVAHAGEPALEVAEIWPGDVVGESALYGGHPVRNASVTAKTDSTLLHLDLEQLAALRGSAMYAALQRQLMEVLVRRIRATDLAIRRAWPAGAPADGSLAIKPAEPSSWERLLTLLGGA
jgi:CRP-like cAMP-binding protein